MFTGVEYDGGEALGKALVICFTLWLAWTIGAVKVCNRNEDRVKEVGGGGFLIAIFGSGIAFILISSLLLITEFYLAFSGSIIYDTGQISTSKSLFWFIVNLLAMAGLVALLTRYIKEGQGPKKQISGAEVIWIGSAALSFLGMGLLWLGIALLPEFYHAQSLYSLRKDIQELIIGLIVLPFFLAFVGGIARWSLS